MSKGKSSNAGILAAIIIGTMLGTLLSVALGLYIYSRIRARIQARQIGARPHCQAGTGGKDEPSGTEEAKDLESKIHVPPPADVATVISSPASSSQGSSPPHNPLASINSASVTPSPPSVVLHG